MDRIGSIIGAPNVREIDRLLLSYSVFRTTYWNDPRGFVEDCIEFPGGQRPSIYQLDCLDALAGTERLAIRAPRGSGKTALAAWITHWWALTRDGRADWKIVLTASNHRQLDRYLLPEIWKWAHHIRWAKVCRPEYSVGKELQLSLLRLSTGEAAPIASDNPESMEGAHASELMVIFDEAKIIPDATWNSMDGAFASQGHGKWLAISTPGPPVGRFYDLHRRAPGYERWATRHISLTDAIAAGRVSSGWADELKATMGADSMAYRTYALAEFAADDDAGLIPLAWIEAAQARWADLADADWRDSRGRELPVSCIAFDVGGGTAHGDASTIAIVRGNIFVDRVIKIQIAPDPSQATMHLAGVVKGLIDKYQPRFCFGDSIGIGAGVVARLREQGYSALPFVASAATTMTDASGFAGMANWRAAGWWALRELLTPQEGRDGMALPPGDELMGDLTAVHDAGVNSRNQHMVESKDSIRKRIGRSTDLADAVMMAAAGPALYTLWAQEQGDGRRVVFDPLVPGDFR